MPKKVRTTQWRKQRRKEYLEKKEYRYYIFCEGEQTEPLYFEVLMVKGSPKLAIRYAKRIIEDGNGKTPTEIAPGTKVYKLVEELARYLPEEDTRQIFANDGRT